MVRTPVALETRCALYTVSSESFAGLAKLFTLLSADSDE